MLWHNAALVMYTLMVICTYADLTLDVLFVLDVKDPEIKRYGVAVLIAATTFSTINSALAGRFAEAVRKFFQAELLYVCAARPLHF